MKLIRLIGGATILALAAATPPAFAEEIILGVKIGAADPDADGFDAISTGSVQLGYEFVDLIAVDVALEAEYSTSLSDAEGPAGDYSYEHKGLFASVRSIGPVYFIGRVGYIDAEIDQAGGAVSDSGAAYGVGIGFSAGVRWELEWTTYEFEENDTNQITLHLAF